MKDRKREGEKEKGEREVDSIGKIDRLGGQHVAAIST